jgi:hypothetical protein
MSIGFGLSRTSASTPPPKGERVDANEWLTHRLEKSNAADVARWQIDERELMDLHVIGDDPVWPFLTRADYETHRKRPSEIEA